MSVEAWKSIFDWATVVLAALTFVALAGAVITGNVLNERQAKQLEQFTLDLERQKSETAKALQSSSEAAARAAEANEKAEREKTARLELERAVSPRRLTGDQKAKLTRLLEGVKAGVAIVSPIADGEASDFADDFDSAIKDASWETIRIKNRITERFGISVVTATGTSLPSIKLLDDALTAIGVPHSAATVKDGDASISPAFQAGYLYLVIEHKPLPTKSK